MTVTSLLQGGGVKQELKRLVANIRIARPLSVQQPTDVFVPVSSFYFSCCARFVRIFCVNFHRLPGVRCSDQQVTGAEACSTTASL